MNEEQKLHETSSRKYGVNPYKTFLHACLLIALVAAGWFLHGMMPGKAPQAGAAAGAGQRRAPTVIAGKVGKASARVPKEFVGHVEAVETVDLRAQVAGYIEKVHFKDGSIVRKGELLFTIEQDPYKAKVALARAQLEQAKADLQGAKAGLQAAKAGLESYKANLVRAKKYLNRLKNADKRSIVQANLDTAQSDYLQAKAQVQSQQAQIEVSKTKIQQIEASIQKAEADLDIAKINLGYTEIKSPIKGKIGTALVTKGNYVAPGNGKLARIVEVNPVHVQFSMSDREYLDMIGGIDKSKEPSSTIRVRLPNGTMYSRKGKWDYQDNEMDPQTGTISAWALFDNPKGMLVPKSYVTVLVKDEKGKMIPAVPQEIVMTDTQGNYVYVINDKNIVKQRRVKLGPTAGGVQRIVSGLKVGEKIVKTGIQKVRPGQKVNVQSAKAKGGAS